MTSHDSGRPDDTTGVDPDADPGMKTSGAGTQPDQAEGDDTPPETKPPHR